MELLIVKRKPVRGSFTRLYNNLVTALKEKDLKPEEIKLKYSSLERVYTDLIKLDEEICNAILVDIAKADEFEKEYNTIEEYKEKFDNARIRITDFLDSHCSKSVGEKIGKTKLKLPEIELVKFSGEIKDWLSFWSQFSRIHNNNSIDDEDKFQYLIQCMTIGGRAREIVDSYPPTAENYVKVIESLKSRFGREELLIEYYVRELLSLVVKNATNVKAKPSVTQLYDKLESHLRSLESIGMNSDRYAAMLFPLVESCIPEEMLRIWLRNPSISTDETSYGDKLSQLLKFLKAEVESEERITLAKKGFKQHESNKNKLKVGS